MHTIEIPYIKFKAEIPSEVSELEPTQAIFVMEQLMLLQAGKIRIEQYRVNLAAFFLNIKITGKYIYFSHKKDLLDQERDLIERINENIFRISETMDSFFIKNEQNNEYVFNYNTTKNLLPQIDRYYGPAQALANCTFFEYKEAHIRFVDFCQSQDEQSLNELIAILYRPKRFFYFLLKYLPYFDGQKRRKFTPSTNGRYFEKRIKRISKIPYYIKFAVFMYFRQCEEYLFNGKPVIDGNEIDLGVLYQGASSNNGKPDIGLTGVLYSLAETNVFGNTEQTANTNLYDVLSRLYQLKIAYDKNKS